MTFRGEKNRTSPGTGNEQMWKRGGRYGPTVETIYKRIPGITCFTSKWTGRLRKAWRSLGTKGSRTRRESNKEGLRGSLSEERGGVEKKEELEKSRGGEKNFLQRPVQLARSTEERRGKRGKHITQRWDRSVPRRQASGNRHSLQALLGEEGGVWGGGGRKVPYGKIPKTLKNHLEN